jgi:hydrogenase maturation protease
MISTIKKKWPTLVVGFGGSDGDDQAGWQLVEMLWRRPKVPARVIVADEWMSLLKLLKNRRRVVIVDSCHSGGPPGSIVRFRWPSARIAECHHYLNPGMGICGTLQLAAQLKRLPEQIDIYGIEVEDCSPGRTISPKIMEAITRLEASLMSELRKMVHV